MIMTANTSIAPIRQQTCCAPVHPLRLDHDEAADLAAAFKAIGNPVRLQILDILSQGSGQVCVCDVEAQFDLAQPTISHHLRVLRQAGLIDAEQRGTWLYYYVRDERMDELRGVLASLTRQDG